MSVDPLGFGAGDSNVYRYLANQPVTTSDPAGLANGRWYDWFVVPPIFRWLHEKSESDRLDEERLYSQSQKEGSVEWIDRNQRDLDVHENRLKPGEANKRLLTNGKMEQYFGDTVGNSGNRAAVMISVTMPITVGTTVLKIAGELLSADAKIVSLLAKYGYKLARSGKLVKAIGKALVPLTRAEEKALMIELRGVKCFKSFEALKKGLGSAGEGKVWHHIVEQRNAAKFGAEAVHSSANVVAVEASINQKIADYYSRSTHAFTGGKTVREWLNSKSFAEQAEFGQKLLELALAGTLP